MQTQEIRLLLEQELGMISQKACGLINQVIKKILPDRGMPLRSMDAGYSTPSPSSGAREVGVLRSPGLATDTERVTRSCSSVVSS